MTDKFIGNGIEGLILSTVEDILAEVVEIEKHLHNRERWLGAAAVPSGEVHVADSILTTKVPFVIDAGNDDWGAWVQVLGSGDSPAIIGNTKFDLHRLNFVDFETNNSTHAVQIAIGASGAAALAAGTYTEFILRTGGGNSFIGPIDVMDTRADVGEKCWVRNWAHGVNTSMLYFFHGSHEYLV